MFNTIQEDFVSEDLVNHLLDVIAISKGENYLEVNNDQLCTVGGIQTKNVVPKLHPLALEELHLKINNYINLYYRYTLDYFKYSINHMHIIDYQPGGYQRKHTHHFNEDHSFIICLNDSDGKTRFFVDDEPLDVPCVRKKICLFSAALFHEGLKCSDRRIIAVGSIRFDHKVWKTT